MSTQPQRTLDIRYPKLPGQHSWSGQPSAGQPGSIADAYAEIAPRSADYSTAAPPSYGASPYAAEIQSIQNHLTALPGQTASALAAAQTRAKFDLAGFGGYSFGEDDPATEEIEGLTPEFNESKAGTGQKEKQARQDIENAMNARGMLHSSLTAQSVGNALNQMSDVARGVLMDYAGQTNQIIGRAISQEDQYRMTLAMRYGDAARWIVDNPPPPKPPTKVWSGKKPPNLETLRARHPGVNFFSRPDGRGGWEVLHT